MENGVGVKGVDVPLEKLVVLHERKASKVGYHKLLSSIKAIGLIEPLCVYEEEDKFVILDGYLRYLACLELGVATVPCLILPTKEAYTCNRMVNYLSAFQESRMLKQSLSTLDSDTIAKTLGLVSIRHRLKTTLLRQLHPKVLDAFDKKILPLQCARDLSFVKPAYQETILKELEKAGDFSVAFARSLILRAPESAKNIGQRKKTPWNRGAERKKELADKLQQVDRQYDFYAKLYRQYVADLLKLCVYVRKLLSRERIAEYVKSRHAEIFERFQEIVFENEEKKEQEVQPH